MFSYTIGISLPGALRARCGPRGGRPGGAGGVGGAVRASASTSPLGGGDQGPTPPGLPPADPSSHTLLRSTLLFTIVLYPSTSTLTTVNLFGKKYIVWQDLKKSGGRGANLVFGILKKIIHILHLKNMFFRKKPKKTPVKHMFSSNIVVKTFSGYFRSSTAG